MYRQYVHGGAADGRTECRDVVVKFDIDRMNVLRRVNPIRTTFRLPENEATASRISVVADCD